MEEATIDVPEGFTLHSENSAHILLPDNNEAFLEAVILGNNVELIGSIDPFK